MYWTGKSGETLRARLSGLNLVGGRLLVTASFFETVKATVTQTNWRSRTGGSCTGRGGVATQVTEDYRQLD